jgi:flavin reductase (DIM6/NTAB) family NADH-FMN oxidoreductase RutF
MAKTQIGPMENLVETFQALSHPGGLLVSLDARRRPNVMTIGWGSIGIFWGRPIFTIVVRPSRYTYQCLEKTGDFTVNLLPRKLADVAGFCGTVSGRDHDKFAESSLTSLPSRHVKSPMIAECVLSYECKVVHTNDLMPKTLARELARSCYPKGDHHRFYYGEILGVTAEENLRRRL